MTARRHTIRREPHAVAVTLRLPRVMHAIACDAAEVDGRSLNSELLHLLNLGLGVRVRANDAAWNVSSCVRPAAGLGDRTGSSVGHRRSTHRPRPVPAPLPGAPTSPLRPVALRQPGLLGISLGARHRPMSSYGGGLSSGKKTSVVEEVEPPESAGSDDEKMAEMTPEMAA